MKRATTILVIVFALFLLLTACAEDDPTPAPATEAPSPTAVPEEVDQPTAEPTIVVVQPEDGEDPIYLSIIWHQHQPVYFKASMSVPGCGCTPRRITWTWLPYWRSTRISRPPST